MDNDSSNVVADSSAQIDTMKKNAKSGTIFFYEIQEKYTYITW